jgi:NitT/TauT family transport system ATP-binding protein
MSDTIALDPTPIVSLKNVHVALGQRGAEIPVLNGLNLDIHRGSFTAFIGPSGCGKTTILNLLADVVTPSSGEVLIQGASPKKTTARAGYMLARDALLPWRSVQKNVELPLELRGHLKAGDRHRVAQNLINRVGLVGYEKHTVHQLSHGMRQRVSLARILAFDPDMLLMDEPFSALDAQTRMRAQEFFLEVWQRDRKTVLLVTHDIQEAIFMADEVLVFSPRPATVIGRFTVDFERPRAIEDLRSDTRFNEIYDEIWRLLKNDVKY